MGLNSPYSLVEVIMSKSDKNRIAEEIERTQVERLRIKLETEREGLRSDQVNLQKTRITTQITQESLLQESIKLNTSKVNTQILQVGLGKTQDKLGYEQADRLLTQQEYTGNLQIKAINVASIFEEVRHQKVMTGNSANTPVIRG